MTGCTNTDCPLRAAAEVRQAGGEYAEAHYLRLKVVDLMHQAGRLRSRLIDMGVDPDIPYEPHPQNPADIRG